MQFSLSNLVVVFSLRQIKSKVPIQFVYTHAPRQHVELYLNAPLVERLISAFITQLSSGPAFAVRRPVQICADDRRRRRFGQDE